MEQAVQRVAGAAQAQMSSNGQAGRTPATEPAKLTEEAKRVVSVSDWLARRLLPSPPWQPDPAWLTQELPVPQMTAGSVATLMSITTLRAISMALLDADPFRPGTATALARVVVTLNARLPAAASAAGGSGRAGMAAALARWSALANVAEAAGRVEDAVASGLFSLPPAQVQAYQAPGGQTMEHWAGFVSRVRALVPLTTVASLLGPELSDPANLAEALRVLRALSVPKLADPERVAVTTAVLAAANRVREAMGTDPARTPFEEVEQAVMSRARQAAQSIPPGAQPPRIAQNPSVIASREMVAAVLSPAVAKLAALTWRVPPASALPALAHLLPALALAKALPPGVTVQKRPCAQGCDAAGLMAAGV